MGQDPDQAPPSSATVMLPGVHYYTGQLLPMADITAAVLVLIGSYTLRHVMVEVGQESTWTRYPTQFNAELLERLHR